jgi:ribosomal protein S18 acetylase RimI-like enzyme
LPADFTIRSAELQDEQKVVELWSACGLVTSYNDPRQDFRFALNKPNSDILVGLAADGTISGSAMVGHDGHRGWIYYVAADPKQRRKGIGRCIVDAAEEWLKQRGVVKVMLLVRETNTDIVSFYQKLGFETTPRTVMQKWLKK